jgi:MFS family permease
VYFTEVTEVKKSVNENVIEDRDTRETVNEQVDQSISQSISKSISKEWSSTANAAKPTIRGQLGLNILWFALNAQSAALLPIVIPTQIILFVSTGQVGTAQQVSFLSGLMLAAAAISLFMPPIIGMISDRTPGIFGRRRPYIVIGGLLLALSTPLLVNTNSMIVFIAGLSLLLIGKNVLAPAYQSLMPDRIAVEHRGKTAGYIGAMTILGNVVGLVLAALLLGSMNAHTSASLIRSNAGIYYTVTALLVVICVLVTVIGVREIPLLTRPHLLHPSTRKTLYALVSRFLHDWIQPWRNHNFTTVFLARAFLMLGLSLFMTYIEYYFARVQHITNFVQVTAAVAIMTLVGAVFSGLVFGILSDRVKRRSLVVAGATLFMGLATLVFVIFPGNLATWLWPLGITFGLGYGAYTSVGWALSIDALPSLENAGKDLGIWNASSTLPAVMAPVVGSLLINLADGAGHTVLGYQLVFGLATLFFILAAVVVLFVKGQSA